MQETLNKYEESSETVAEVLGAVVTDVLQKLDLMSAENEVGVQCFKYDPVGEAQMELDCDDGEAKSVQWTIPLGKTYVCSLLCNSLHRPIVEFRYLKIFSFSLVFAYPVD